MSRAADLCAACSLGDLGAVKRLLADGASPDLAGDRFTALSLAAARGHVGVARALVSVGAARNRMDPGGSTALNEAVMAGDKEMVLVLVREAGWDVNMVADTGMAPLHTAVVYKKPLDMVELLLSCGAEPNLRGRYDVTALFFAAQERQADAAELLLKAGADPNQGRPPLLMAMQRGYTDIVRMLMVHGVEVDRADSRGVTPLHNSAGDGRIGDVEMLLAAGADVKCVDGRGWTPLMVAAHSGHCAVVELLLRHGSPVDHRDSSGNTALDVSRLKQHGNYRPIACALLEAGASCDHMSDRAQLRLLRWWRARSHDMLAALKRQVDRFKFAIPVLVASAGEACEAIRAKRR